MLSNTLERRIEWGDCDPAGIVYNPNFFSYFDHGTAMLFEAAGWPKMSIREEFDVVGWPVVTTEADFKAPCTYGDNVTITSTVSSVGRSSFSIKHELFNNGELCVEGQETRVWTVTDSKTGRLKSAPIPEEIVQRFCKP